MADIKTIQELARQLRLNHIAAGDVELNNEDLSNLDYLESVLKAEVDLHREDRAARLRKRCRLPQKVFDATGLNDGQQWQLEEIKKLAWIQKAENLLIIGKCGTGKTSLAATIGEIALYSGVQTFYTTAEDLMTIVHKRDVQQRANSLFEYMKGSDLIIVDDLFYTDYTRAELHDLYRGMAFLNETRSLLCITNREVSSWIDAAEDRHLAQTLSDRIVTGCQILRLT